MANKVGLYIKVSADNPEPYLSIIKNYLLTRVRKMKGKRFFNYKFTIGRDNEDFAKDITTVMLTARWYKKPRFIK